MSPHGLPDDRLFESAFRHAAIGMCLVSLDGRFLQVNDALCRIVGYTRHELLALDFQTITHPDDLDIDLGRVDALVAGDIESYHLEKRYLHRDGHVVWILLTVSLVTAEDGRPQFFISQVQDISEQKRMRGELERLASTDGLTGLLNRRRVTELAERELRRRDRHAIDLAVLVVDADHFKSINDRHGPQAGDMVLRALGALLAAELRETDLLCRWGGEEFVALLIGTDLDGARRAAERMVLRCAGSEVTHDSGAIRVTVSIGVTACAPDEHDFESVVERADRAMYAAKQAGRNTVVVG
jgi:diguanylate cyclase (GGDEF)-like protein/PAS domain S-box-containing protein